MSALALALAWLASAALLFYAGWRLGDAGARRRIVRAILTDPEARNAVIEAWLTLGAATLQPQDDHARKKDRLH